MVTATIFGTINADGSTLSGEGFSASLQETGTYQITFDQSFEGVPAIVGSQTGYGPGENPIDNVAFPYLEVGSATAITGDSGGNRTNRQFSFIAIGQVW